MNDDKAKAYRWAANVLDAKAYIGADFATKGIKTEAYRIIDALRAAAENRAAAPEVPPSDQTMVAPGYGPARDGGVKGGNGASLRDTSPPSPAKPPGACADWPGPCVHDECREERGFAILERARARRDKDSNVASCSPQGHAKATDKAALAVPLPCSVCGEPVEVARRCYVVPTCYACLPPPEPLPVVSLAEMTARTMSAPAAIVALEPVPPPPCPKCGAFVEWGAMATHPCGVVR